MVPVLVILDGWGHGPPGPYNAIAVGNTPTWDYHWERAPRSLLECSGEHVGLPPGQMGNSEVGHMAIGAGRVIHQDLTRINAAIADGSFYRAEALVNLLNHIGNGRVHIMGLFSPGGVHSHSDQILALTKHLCELKQPLSVHCFLDGRDTPPQSALESIETLESLLKSHEVPDIASISGRYYAMDRDKRWERVARAYDMLTGIEGSLVEESGITALKSAYARDESDEFVQPTRTRDFHPVQDGDAVIFMNFRADRARQLSGAFLYDDFTGFKRRIRPQLTRFVTLTPYSKEINEQTHSIEVSTLFPNPVVANSLGQCFEQHGLRQLRIAESEKYAHVTYFFSGGKEAVFENETRNIVPSPKVHTYDLQPEMNAPQLTDEIIQALQSGSYDAIICNYANGDMVGHTGNFEASVKAVECVDHCLSRLFEACEKHNGYCFVTADHGNVESLFDHHSNQANTAHTSNPVPFVYVGPRTLKFKEKGAITDIAPTILHTMDLPIPPEMSGTSLIESQDRD